MPRQAVLELVFIAALCLAPAAFSATVQQHKEEAGQCPHQASGELQEAQVVQGADNMPQHRPSGKDSWPELLGLPFADAEKVLKRDAPDVSGFVPRAGSRGFRQHGIGFRQHAAWHAFHDVWPARARAKAINLLSTLACVCSAVQDRQAAPGLHGDR